MKFDRFFVLFKQLNVIPLQTNCNNFIKSKATLNNYKFKKKPCIIRLLVCHLRNIYLQVKLLRLCKTQITVRKADADVPVWLTVSVRGPAVAAAWP